MLEIESRYPDGLHPRITDVNLDLLGRRAIMTGRHCFGCTAGAGSSCGGAIE